MRADYARFRAFVESAQRGSFSSAAQALGYTPSGIIRLANALEQELGVRLLRRDSRGVVPTAEGERLLPFAWKVIHSYEAVGEMASKLAGAVEGRLRIGAKHSVAALQLPAITRAFREKHPGIVLDICENGTAQILAGLGCGEFDCGFLTSRPSCFDWVPLRTTWLVAWIPKDHPFASRQTIDIHEFEGAPFVKAHPDGSTDVERALSEAGVSVDIRVTTQDCYTAYKLVEAGVGLGANIPEMSEGWQGEVVAVPITPKQPIEFGIAYSTSEASPALEAFLACVSEQSASCEDS